MKTLNVLRLAAAALAVLAAVTPAAGQLLPAMLYGDSLEERCHALCEGVDPGFCLAGWTRSYSPAPAHTHKILVINTDQGGIPQWARVSVGGLDEEAHSMVRTADNGYCLTGWTRSYGVGIPNTNLFVIKLDLYGNAQWSYVWGWMADDEAYSIVQTLDGGYAVAGLTHSFGPAPYPNILVSKFAANGFLQWVRAYWTMPNHVEDEGYAIIQTPDTGYAVVGRAKVSSPVTFDPFVLKLDQTGGVQWAEFSPGAYSDDEGHAAILDLNNQIVAGGWTRSFGSGPPTTADMFVATFSLGGILGWSRTFGWPVGDEQLLEDRSLCAAHDGAVAAAGPTTSLGPGAPNPNFMLLKLTPAGNVQWCRTHPSPFNPGLQNDVARPMIETANRDYAAAGWSDSYTYLGREDFHLVAVDSAGDRPVCVEPQTPILDSMPWTEVVMADTSVFLEPDSMPLVPVDVNWAAICEDTTAVREGRPTPGFEATGPRLVPSPARGAVRVTGLDAPARLVLYDASGREAARFELLGRRETRLDISKLAAGVYLARFEGRGGVTRTRLLVR